MIKIVQNRKLQIKRIISPEKHYGKMKVLLTSMGMNPHESKSRNLIG